MFKNSAPSASRVYMDSNAFFEQLTADVQKAKQSIRIQCMSFEADKVGTKLIELLGSKPTLERILLIDDYSRHVVNDTFLHAPQGWINKNNAREERKKLDPLIARAREMGITVKFTSPVGFLMHRYPARNHKKIVLIDDDISYLGGLNFTEHNFQWSDLMIRHTDPDIAAALKTSFLADLENKTAPTITEINSDTTLYTLNGFKSKSAYEHLLEQIRASNKIVAISPYISYPMLDTIAAVPDNTVILPKTNNKPLIRFLHGLKRYSDINFKYVSGKMLHAKLLILNDEKVIYGSSNFDIISYFFEKEIILVQKGDSLIQQLKTFTSQLINK